MASWDIGSLGFAPEGWNKKANEFFFGSDSKMKNYNKSSLQSLMQMLNGGGISSNPLYQQGSNYLQGLLSNDPAQMQAFSQPYINQFNQEIAPGIAQRFAGSGTGSGALSSSSFGNSLAQAGSNLQAQLASMRSGMQLQGAQQALGYANQPFQNILQAAGLIPGQYYEQPGQGGLVQGGLNSFLNGFGQSLGGGF